MLASPINSEEPEEKEEWIESEPYLSWSSCAPQNIAEATASRVWGKKGHCHNVIVRMEALIGRALLLQADQNL